MTAEMVILGICVVVLGFVVCVFVPIYLATTEEEIKYEIITYIAEKNDTFWKYYEKGYYGWYPYQEALTLFMKDNKMKTYKLKAGQRIKLRWAVLEDV